MHLQQEPMSVRTEQVRIYNLSTMDGEPSLKKSVPLCSVLFRFVPFRSWGRVIDGTVSEHVWNLNGA